MIRTAFLAVLVVLAGCSMRGWDYLRLEADGAAHHAQLCGGKIGPPVIVEFNHGPLTFRMNPQPNGGSRPYLRLFAPADVVVTMDDPTLVFYPAGDTSGPIAVSVRYRLDRKGRLEGFAQKDGRLLYGFGMELPESIGRDGYFTLPEIAVDGRVLPEKRIRYRWATHYGILVNC